MNGRSQVSPRNPDGTRGRVGPHLGPLRLTPTRVTLAVALGGSALYLIYAILFRNDLQVPLLSSGAAILGLVFAALAVSGAVSTYRAAVDGQGLRAFLWAIGGGLAGLVAFACFTAAVLLALIWQLS